MYAVPRGCTVTEARDFISYLHETSPTEGADPSVLTLPDFYIVASRIAARAMDGLFFATMTTSERLAAIELKRSMGVPLAGYEEGFEREQRALRKQREAMPVARPSSSFQSIGRSNRWVRPGLPDAPTPQRPPKIERHLPVSEQPQSARVAAVRPLALPAPPMNSRPPSGAPKLIMSTPDRATTPRAASARRADNSLIATLKALHGFRSS
jgi:hypothetical protein